MSSPSTMTKPSHLYVSNSLLLLLLSSLLDRSVVSSASLRDHRLRGADVNEPAPNEDMLKALEYIQSLRQNAKPQRSFESEEPPSEDKSEELLQAVLSTLQQTEKADNPKTLESAKAQAITPHKEMPLLFEDDEKQDASEKYNRADNFKRMNENVEEKYTPQNLATLQSVFDELGKMNFNFNSKRETSEEDELNARDVAYDETDWDQEDAEENRHEFERALDYLGANENDESDFVSKRSDDEDDGEMANLADFYLLKVLEQTEEEEQKKREIEEEEEEQERLERSASEYRGSIDPKTIYRLLQISQKYQIPPEDLVDMLRTGEITRLKVAPVYTKKTYKKPEYFSRRLPLRQKSPDELRTERILKILGVSSDENSVQSPFRKQYKSTYARPVWRQSLIAKQPQQKQRFPTKLKDDYDDTENELATFLAARMLSKYPSYRSKMSQKREETEEEEEAGNSRGLCRTILTNWTRREARTDRSPTWRKETRWILTMKR
ncbi:hypothetical protein WMY93_020922 [Mugilogobius chulae]|uniref:Secretogranin-2 n=1 Tax=Mugilogobius chulae TaxID=88201 RepID=A0AAW0N963_9GOBI